MGGNRYQVTNAISVVCAMPYRRHVCIQGYIRVDLSIQKHLCTALAGHPRLVPLSCGWSVLSHVVKVSIFAKGQCAKVYNKHC
jgi:hypothetical protein